MDDCLFGVIIYLNGARHCISYFEEVEVAERINYGSEGEDKRDEGAEEAEED